MIEVNKRSCKLCKENKDRIQNGKYPGQGNNKRWVDNAGKLWSGSICPDCNTKRVKEVMKKSRSKPDGAI